MGYDEYAQLKMGTQRNKKFRLGKPFMVKVIPIHSVMKIARQMGRYIVVSNDYL